MSLSPKNFKRRGRSHQLASLVLWSVVFLDPTRRTCKHALSRRELRFPYSQHSMSASVESVSAVLYPGPPRHLVDLLADQPVDRAETSSRDDRQHTSPNAVESSGHPPCIDTPRDGVVEAIIFFPQTPQTVGAQVERRPEDSSADTKAIAVESSETTDVVSRSGSGDPTAEGDERHLVPEVVGEPVH